MPSKPSPEYTARTSMNARCNDPNRTGYAHYGARGIYVFPRRRYDFAAFFADLGPRPSKSHSIDRINNDGSYTCGKCEHCVARSAPMNCRWATRKVQRRNTSTNHFVTYNGETACVTEWAERLGVDPEKLRNRIKDGWDIERAFTLPYLVKRAHPRCAVLYLRCARECHDCSATVANPCPRQRKHGGRKFAKTGKSKPSYRGSTQTCSVCGAPFVARWTRKVWNCGKACAMIAKQRRVEY